MSLEPFIDLGLGFLTGRMGISETFILSCLLSKIVEISQEDKTNIYEKTVENNIQFNLLINAIV
jgi:hypothetical protein